MSTAFFSQSWHLVSHLKPKLRTYAAIHRHTYRDEVWYILQDDINGQFHRFTASAYQMIGMMDGRLSLQEIWEASCYQLGDDMPTQDDIIMLVSKLFRANVLQSDVMPNIDELHHQRQTTSRRKLLQKLKSPLGIKIPLLDPENFLQRTSFMATALFSRFSAAIWLLVVIVGIVSAGVHWQALTHNIDDRILSVNNLLLIIIVYPFVKIVHELGHAYAVKRWGGEVHEIGVMLLVFFPVPYVEASAASSFRNKYQRMLVGAAGIMVEVFIASVAMVVWTMVEPGVVRSIAFNTMTIAGISTLLFNGNPLLRFDAYYVLADYLEIPNLAKRSNETFGYFIKKFICGVDEITAPFKTNAEATIMTFYSVAAFIYRLVIMVVISLFIASEYYLIGILLAIWSIYMTVIEPLIKTLAKPFSDFQLQERKRRIFFAGSFFVTTVVLLLAVVPAPYSTQSEGVLWTSEKEFVRAGSHGFVKQLLIQSDQPVTPGDTIMVLEEPSLSARAEVLKAQVQEAQARFQANAADRVESTINAEVLQFREKEYQRALERQEALAVESQLSGTLVIPNQESLVGKYVQQGEMLGYIVDYPTLPAVTLVAEDFIEQVRHNLVDIQVRLVSDRNTSYSGTIRRITPSSSHDLPSDILAIEGGGVVALDPNQESASLNPYFHLVIDIPDAPKTRLNERVYVRFEHKPEPIILRWYRGARRVFLRQLDV